MTTNKNIIKYKDIEIEFCNGFYYLVDNTNIEFKELQDMKDYIDNIWLEVIDNSSWLDGILDLEEGSAFSLINSSFKY